MDDRELLKLAAKAAGYVVRWYDDTLHCGPTFGIEVEPGNPCGFDPWNPLTDDGDALRLAVNLNLDVCIHGCSVDVYSGDLDEEITEIVDHGESLESTRRAIVRAAAEIGRVMP